jgi:hypothetical protein
MLKHIFLHLAEKIYFYNLQTDRLRAFDVFFFSERHKVEIVLLTRIK